MAKNRGLNKAKKEKNDEFYTQLSDIEKEIIHYKEHFKNKIVYCNCDDPEWSNFWKYFEICFDHLGLKKLISTHYESDKPSYKLELENIDGELIETKTPLEQNGDFRSPECVEILKECDIVVTNPPFSLFREYVSQLMEYNKKFLVIGNMNAITYNEIFQYIKNNEMWPICRKGGICMDFELSKNYTVFGAQVKYTEGKTLVSVSGALWFTNMECHKRREFFILYKEYSESEYPKYDNYNAINVDKAKDIPKDYYGEIGVPISFLVKLCPDQFEIVDRINCPSINGKTMYKRLIIKRKNI